MERPDLNNTDPKIVAYIEYLEKQIKPASSTRRTSQEAAPAAPMFRADEPPMPAESPTSINIISSSHNGLAKRTHRHHYIRQHRSGMGIFDIEVNEPDFPAILASVDDSQNLLLFTNRARVYRIPLIKVPEEEIRSRGEDILTRLPLEQGEFPVKILPEKSSGYIAMVSANGWVRSLRHHLFGEHMKSGTAMFPFNDYGPLVDACWSNGDGELLVVTRQGTGIRFTEKMIAPQGSYAIKLSQNDAVAGLAPVYEDSNVLVVAADGKGAARSMSGFIANKSLGGSGKQFFKSDQVIGLATVTGDEDVFIISQLGKIIRFKSDEVPVNDGVVQGVICMNLRGDQVTAMVISGSIF
jgi:DNA gyrase subunit A